MIKNVLISIYSFKAITIVIGNLSTVNKYESGSFFNIDFGDLTAGELIISICAPPFYEAKFSRY